MRVTSNMSTELLINGSQNAQQRLAVLQQEIATGQSVEEPSDNPLAYEQASQVQTQLAQLNDYSDAVSQATTETAQNNAAMTSLHQIVAQASELATSVSGTMSTSDMQNLGTQMSALLTQLTSTVNQQSNGNYLFGGTSNQPPIDTTTQTYNPATNGQTASIDVQAGNSVQTGIVAGRSGSPPVDGFLYDSATGVDVVGALTQTIADLNSGDVTAVQSTDLPALNAALNHVSLYVGSTAAEMTAVQTAGNQNSQLTTADETQLSELTQTNLPTATIQLEQIQNQYEASLSAGTRIMGLSILNYISSVPSS